MSKGLQHRPDGSQKAGHAATTSLAPGKRTLTESLPDHTGPLQKKAAAGATPAPAASAPTGGSALPEAVQSKMGPAFGADFSSVRVHEGAHVSALGALAYTQGSNVHFAPGNYDPHGARGQELIGHELAHVVQQSEGRVAPTLQAAGLGINDDAGLEREADEMGARAARGQPTGSGSATAPDPGSGQLHTRAAQARSVRRCGAARRTVDTLGESSSTRSITSRPPGWRSRSTSSLVISSMRRRSA